MGWCDVAPSVGKPDEGVRTRTSQTSALVGIRVVARAVALASAAIGVAYAAISIVGPSVWVFSNDGSGAGSFVTMPLALRMVHAGAGLLGCLVVTAIALLLVDLAGQIRPRVSFTASLSRTTWALALTVGIGPWLAQIAASLARWSWVVHPDGPAHGTDPSSLPIEWNLGLHTFTPNWPLLGVAIVLAMLAWIVQAGERMQHDLEGLV